MSLRCLMENGNYSKSRIGGMFAIIAGLGCFIWLICLSVLESNHKDRVPEVPKGMFRIKIVKLKS